jgi:hypothetical protein
MLQTVIIPWMHKYEFDVRFEVFMVMKIEFLVFWGVVPCSVMAG